MHELRLIHTDLKPENILLVSPECIKVPDYKVYFVLLLDWPSHDLPFAVPFCFWCIGCRSLKKRCYWFLSLIVRLHSDPQRREPIISGCPSPMLSRWLISVALPMIDRIRVMWYPLGIIGLQKLYWVSVLSSEIFPSSAWFRWLSMTAWIFCSGLGWSYPCDIWSVGCILVELCMVRIGPHFDFPCTTSTGDLS